MESSADSSRNSEMSIPFVALVVPGSKSMMVLSAEKPLATSNSPVIHVGKCWRVLWCLSRNRVLPVPSFLWTMNTPVQLGIVTISRSTMAIIMDVTAA